jgi:CheY-like chemotaxis protein
VADVNFRLSFFFDFETERQVSLQKSLTKRSDRSMANLNGEKKRILLVEDEEDAKELAAFTLPEYMLICASDFSEGLRLARRGYFDLYILDSWLPDRSGVELCRIIREFDPHTPILFYSAAAYARDIRVIPDKLRQAVAQLISAATETAS